MASKNFLTNVEGTQIIEALYNPLFPYNFGTMRKSKQRNRFSKDFLQFQIFMSDMRTIIFFAIIFALGIDKFLLLLYLIRGRFPRDMLLFYSVHSLSFTFMFMNIMVNEEILVYSNLLTRILKLCFTGAIIINSVVFLMIVVGLLILTILFVCFPQLRNHFRGRIGHYDRLIEQMAQNDGMANRFEENQPLTDEEMKELQSFIKTDSFIDIYNPSAESKLKSKHQEMTYNPLKDDAEGSDNILMELNRWG